MNFVVNIIKEAQKQIDKALDIQEEEQQQRQQDGTATTTRAVAPTVTSVRRVPGMANKEKAKTDPAMPTVSGYANIGTGERLAVAAAAPPLVAGTANWGSFTGSFFENPNAHSTMVTIPPKAALSAVMMAAESSSEAIASISSTSSSSTAGTKKRQSVTSNSASVDLLSAPNSPCSELTSPSEAAVEANKDSSESVEVVTAPPSSEIASPGDSCPSSIVVITGDDENCHNYDAVDDEDDSISYSTIINDDALAVSGKSSAPTSDKIDSPHAKQRHTPTMGGDVSRISSTLEHSGSSSGTAKLFMSMEDVTPYELQTVDSSDSTQSFEEIQMQCSVESESIPTFAMASTQHFSNSTSPQNSNSNSNDEVETTTTSSDIEIISNPNGDSSSTSTTRTSPTKKPSGHSHGGHALCGGNGGEGVASKKGHCRELSEISILSEDSQAAEHDKLLHRISELNEIIESRELRLLQSERQNAALQERTNELQVLVDAMRGNTAEEYTQRLSALEKKFQTSIRERDSLRIQIKALKEELQQKIPKGDLTELVAESEAMIAELRLEGEKLSKDILQQSNIIKKLRTKEKYCEAVLKKNKDQIASLNDELERLKKTLNAKEEVERSQIEAVHKMSSEKRKLDEDNAQSRSKIEDLTSKLETLQCSFDALKEEAQKRTQLHTDITRTNEEAVAARRQREATLAENKEIALQMSELREKLRNTEQNTAHREQQLREENRQLLQRLEAAELRAESTTQDVSLSTIPLVRQLESLQQALCQRTNAWNKEERMLLEKLDVAESRAKQLELAETMLQEKHVLLRKQCADLEAKLSLALLAEEQTKIALHRAQLDIDVKEEALKSVPTIQALEERIKCLEDMNSSLESKLKQAQSNESTRLEQSVLAHDQSSSTDDLATLQEAPPLQQQVQNARHEQRSYSPDLSMDMNSLEEVMGGGNIDLQVDDMDCLSLSGRNAGSLVYGMQLNTHLLGHNTTTMEHLHALLKQRDGELHHLQWVHARLQAERGVLNEEIAKLTLELENANDRLQSFESLTENFDELQHNYDALLEMYGEKVERTEELELDLVELKEAYKLQIDELLAQPPRQPTT